MSSLKYLKLKDNIDFRELEKLGFKAVTIVNEIRYQFVEIIGNVEIYNIKIDCNNVIRYNQETTYNYIPAIILDLFKNDMVEVVN